MWKKYLALTRPETWNDEGASSAVKRFFYRCMRLILATAQSFISDKGFDKASTLTFYTLLAIIPLLAICFGIAQVLGFADQFTEQVKTQLASQPQVAEKLIEFSNSTLKTTRGGLIASLGLLVLFWTVLKTLGNIETFFDEIWQVRKPRTFLQAIKSYTPLILLFPLFVVGSSSVILYSSTTAVAASQALPILSGLSPLIMYFFNFISYLVSWLLLSFLYIYLPNTSVSWKAGLLAGIVTGLLFFLWQWVYVTFQVQASSYGAIYGSFAAVPLFLIWLNYSWIIIILGAIICFHLHREINKENSKKDDAPRD